VVSDYQKFENTLVQIYIYICMYVWSTAKWYWQRKTEELRDKPVPGTLCPPQILHGLTRLRTWASALRAWRLTARAMARPCCFVKGIEFFDQLWKWASQEE
jgi:hypothetical protein